MLGIIKKVKNKKEIKKHDKRYLDESIELEMKRFYIRYCMWLTQHKNQTKGGKYNGM